MTPAETFLSDSGLAITKWNEIEATRRFLNGLQPGQTAKMIEALRKENANLRDGIQALQAANDELAEQNTSQRRYILELLAENRKLSELLDRAMDALEP